MCIRDRAQYADYKSTRKVLTTLEGLPNFHLKLTEEEKDIISHDGNVLVIGRSGTGKTSCAILRLFALELLFKVRLTQAKLAAVEKVGENARFKAEDIDVSLGLHSIFAVSYTHLTLPTIYSV
eukprot:TRINITY_DN7531_c0_g1_i2.p1 TRINITY_DN7531_c0_g1~~TRINITY_DN7531_c0_g1_i2.p1  ORF type:complete len:139 (-),score=39.23 TRINITY_DN7531_c0_g1_i2:35-403(-)